MARWDRIGVVMKREFRLLARGYVQLAQELAPFLRQAGVPAAGAAWLAHGRQGVRFTPAFRDGFAGL